MQVITNGLILEPELISKLTEAGIAAIGISIDGMAETHDSIRGHKGLHKHILKEIEKINKAELPVTVITTVNALNLHELPNMLETLKSANVNKWQVQPIFPIGRGLEESKLHLSDQMYQKFGSFIKEWSSKARKEGLKIETADSYGYFTEYDVREIPFRGCPAGLVTCGITSDGKIKGCLSLPDDQIEGDLRQADFWDIWFNKNSFKYTRDFSIKEAGNNCRSCKYIEQCKGGCSAMSYSCTGFYHNDPFCLYRIMGKNGTS